MLRKKFIALLIIAIIAIITSGSIILLIYSMSSSPSDNSQITPPPITENALDEEVYSTESAGLANPASTKCTELGGKLSIEKRDDGSEYGVCIFEDGNTCEEWALFKDFCPVGGVEINESASSPEKFCLQSGGNINDDNELCELPDGNSCNIDKYYTGGCE